MFHGDCSVPLVTVVARVLLPERYAVNHTCRVTNQNNSQISALTVYAHYQFKDYLFKIVNLVHLDYIPHYICYK